MAVAFLPDQAIFDHIYFSEIWDSRTNREMTPDYLADLTWNRRSKDYSYIHFLTQRYIHLWMYPKWMYLKVDVPKSGCTQKWMYPKKDVPIVDVPKTVDVPTVDVPKTIPCMNPMVKTRLSLNPQIFVKNGFFKSHKYLKTFWMVDL